MAAEEVEGRRAAPGVVVVVVVARGPVRVRRRVDPGEGEARARGPAAGRREAAKRADRGDGRARRGEARAGGAVVGGVAVVDDEGVGEVLRVPRGRGRRRLRTELGLDRVVDGVAGPGPKTRESL